MRDDAELCCGKGLARFKVLQTTLLKLLCCDPCKWCNEKSEEALSFGHIADVGLNATELLITHTGVCRGGDGDFVCLVPVHCSVLASCETGMPRREEEKAALWGMGVWLVIALFLPFSLYLTHTH